MKNSRVIVVDVQKDFLPGGALPVPDGDAVVEPINRLIDAFPSRIIFTMDSHPRDHVSFASSHGAEPFTKSPSGETLWPDHCVKGTPGWTITESLAATDVLVTVEKGTLGLWDSYSGFYIGGGEPSGLKSRLDAARCDSVVVCGLATDYCVKATALDARKYGFQTWVVVDACRGVDATPGDVERAYVEMSRAGVQFLSTDQLVNPTGKRILDEDARGGAE